MCARAFGHVLLLWLKCKMFCVVGLQGKMHTSPFINGLTFDLFIIKVFSQFRKSPSMKPLKCSLEPFGVVVFINIC